MARQQSFTAQIDAWVLKSRKRMLAVFQTATQFVIEDILERTPVVTGHLRASFVASVKGPAPINKASRPKYGTEKNSFAAPTQYTMAIAGVKLGQSIFGTFTAAYAPYVEYGTRGHAGRGMVRLAAQNWEQHVAKATAMAKAQVNK